MRLRRRLHRPVVVTFERPRVAIPNVGMRHAVAISVVVVVDMRWLQR